MLFQLRCLRGAERCSAYLSIQGGDTKRRAFHCSNVRGLRHGKAEFPPSFTKSGKLTMFDQSLLRLYGKFQGGSGENIIHGTIKQDAGARDSKGDGNDFLQFHAI